MRLSLSIYALLATFSSCSSAADANTTSDIPTLELGTDSAFNFQYLIALGDAPTGGSDIAPVLGAAKNIKAGDMNSFSQQFYQLANYTKAMAQDPENAYDPINVRDMWFSAAQYFRRADMFLHGNWSNPLINTLWAEQTAAFDKAMAALPVPGQRVRIPAKKGNFTIEAIWYSVTGSNSEQRPTLIIGNGFDAAQEDSYHYFVAAGLARGWNCITYEGPGQPTVLREENLGFIPDWENVVIPVVDYVLSEKSQVVDQRRLVLVGNSFGGYLAARAAAFEPRLSAAVLIDGVWDVYAGYSAELPSDLLSMYEAGNYSEFDEELLSLRQAGKLDTNTAWGLDQGLWVFRTHSPSEFFNQAKQYRLADVADRINMPVFVGDAEFENIFPGQAQQVAEAIGDNATRHRFNGTAGYHCQTGATQEMTTAMFAWLNKTLGAVNVTV
ncbi:putative hydrolases or acyltransferase [Aspergillus sclerotioniger CBS 115572]|uniref:Putative hydrolases or acyltransferase n=1 Tax=Aspergillus sclerotioniger CBS 115572 TaxID=1450535 RepID=A0A317W6K0_9EURO|nr:putative hydrolases or acyltransferase [Aspergillus sclerotioniger CBS 115572]PWY81585.1 putative hydrolases or acyltransferase [Aspergillus sclerotioniger CBS 115572]